MSLLSLLVVTCVIIYNAAFGMSWGPVPWLYPPEIMPLPFRAKGVSLSTATNWLFVCLVSCNVGLARHMTDRAELLGRRINAKVSGANRMEAVPDACLLLLRFIRTG